MKEISIDQILETLIKGKDDLEFAKERIGTIALIPDRIKIVERDNDNLFAGLKEHCIGQRTIRCSPIVMKAGYVMWVDDGFHQPALQLATMLVSDAGYDHADYFIRHNHGWFISSMGKGSVVCGKDYTFTRDDQTVLSDFFTVDRLPY